MDRLKFTEGYSVTPTIVEILRECDTAWSRAQSLRSHSDNAEQVYLELHREFADLCNTYPTVVAAMAAGNYNRKAAKKFFKYVSENKWETKEQFHEVQTAYFTFLERALSRHPDEAAIRQRRQAAIRAMEEEEQQAKKEIEEAQAEADRLNKIRSEQRARDFLARVPHDARIITEGEVRPVRVIIDDI